MKFRFFEVPMSERDLCFFDTETTGFELEKELLEIGAVRAKANTFEVINEIDIKIKPQKLEVASPEALEVVGYNEKEWEEEGVESKEGIEKFLEFADDTILVAHNLPFDWMHIQNALEQHNMQPTYFYKGLDVFALAWLILGKDPIKFPHLSLRELAEHFNIDMGSHHRGIDDARTAYKIFVELIKTHDKGK